MIRPRRSVLFMPGSNARALEKARSLPADGIIFDLEDSVAPEEKPNARTQIAQALRFRHERGAQAVGDRQRLPATNTARRVHHRHRQALVNSAR